MSGELNGRRVPALSDIVLDGHGPRYEQIRRAIAALVTSGAWRPGTRVPSEHELMAYTGSSRMTVHRALSALAQDGLIVRRRRAGTLVAVPPAEHAVLAIPSIPEEIAAGGHSHGYALLQRRLGRASRSIADRFGVGAGERVVYLEALHCADAVPHVLEQRVIVLSAVPRAASTDFSRVAPGTWLLANVPWSRAHHAISAIAADRSSAALLDVEVGSPCLLVERQTWHGSWHLTSARLIYPGSRHRLVGEFGPYPPSRSARPAAPG
jgi:GntR family histidine utilization transcriptional repressor